MKIISYRERTWFSGPYEDNTDFRQWDHMCRSFGVDLQMIDNWSEAIIPDNSNIYLVDEEGDIDILDHVVDINGVYVFGKTAMRLKLIIESYNSVIRINTPNPICLFGISAASILLGRIL